MEIIPQLISRYSVVLYAICGVACIYFLFTGLASLRELKRVIFRLERNAVLTRAVSSMLKAVLCLVGGGAVFAISAFAPAQSTGVLMGVATSTSAGIVLLPTSMPTAVITEGQILANVDFTPTIVYVGAAGTATGVSDEQLAASPQPADAAGAAQTPTVAPPPTEAPPPTPALPTSTEIPAATATPAIVTDCSQPEAQITSPASDEVIVGAYAVRGTAIVEAGGWYKLEILTPGAVQWSFLGRGDATVKGDVLLNNFNAGDFMPGVYPFRLMIIGADANVKAICSMPITIGQ